MPFLVDKWQPRTNINKDVVIEVIPRRGEEDGVDITPYKHYYFDNMNIYKIEAKYREECEVKFLAVGESLKR